LLTEIHLIAEVVPSKTIALIKTQMMGAYSDKMEVLDHCWGSQCSATGPGVPMLGASLMSVPATLAATDKDIKNIK